MDHTKSALSARAIDRRTVLMAGGAGAIALGVGAGLVKTPAVTLLGVAILVSFLLPAWVPLAVALVATWFRAVVPEFPSGILLSDLALAIFVVRWSVPWLFSAGRLRLPAPCWWLVSLIGWAWVTMVFSGGDEFLALGRVTEYAFIFVAASVSPGSSRPLFLLAAIVAASQVGALLIAQQLPIGDLHQFGQLAMAGLAGAQFIRSSIWRRAFTLVSVIAILLCFRRGIWIASAVQGGVLLIPLLHRHGGRRRVIIAALLGAALVGLMYQVQDDLTAWLRLNTESLAIRQAGWSDAIVAIREEPFVGHGWATAIDNGQPAYSLLLNVAASIGIPGAVLLLGFVGTLTLQLADQQTRESLAGFAYLVGFLVLSLAEMTWYAAAPATLTFFILLGSLLGDRGEKFTPSFRRSGELALPSLAR